MTDLSEPLRDRTIRDFGEQWTRYRDAAGFFGSRSLLEGFVGPMLDWRVLSGARVADIGAGTGRFARVLAEAGAGAVLAVEPSEAFEVLRANVADLGERVTCLRIRGDELPPSADLDLALSIGVLHHIPDPAPVVRAVFAGLKPGGQFVAWLYGVEGCETYLRLVHPALSITRRLPHRLLAAVVWLTYWPAVAYMQASRVLSLPLRTYMREVFRPLTPLKRRVVIYDQLNPSYVRHYTASEARGLLSEAGFEDVRLYHRHGSSWTVAGRKPAGPA